jgi:hypothetical protein
MYRYGHSPTAHVRLLTDQELHALLATCKRLHAARLAGDRDIQHEHCANSNLRLSDHIEVISTFRQHEDLGSE